MMKVIRHLHFTDQKEWQTELADVNTGQIGNKNQLKKFREFFAQNLMKKPILSTAVYTDRRQTITVSKIINYFHGKLVFSANPFNKKKFDELINKKTKHALYEFLSEMSGNSEYIPFKNLFDLD